MTNRLLYRDSNLTHLIRTDQDPVDTDPDTVDMDPYTVDTDPDTVDTDPPLHKYNIIVDNIVKTEL